MGIHLWKKVRSIERNARDLAVRTRARSGAKRTRENRRRVREKERRQTYPWSGSGAEVHAAEVLSVLSDPEQTNMAASRIPSPHRVGKGPGIGLRMRAGLNWRAGACREGPGRVCGRP